MAKITIMWSANPPSILFNQNGEFYGSGRLNVEKTTQVVAKKLISLVGRQILQDLPNMFAGFNNRISIPSGAMTSFDVSDNVAPAVQEFLQKMINDPVDPEMVDQLDKIQEWNDFDIAHNVHATVTIS